MAQDDTYITIAGLRELERELDQLRAVKRKEVAGRIQEAKEIGETDNAGSEYAKNEYAQVERRIQELEGMIQNAIIIPDHALASAKADIIEVGSIVKVQPLGSTRTGTYTIVGSTEASPSEGRISNESPLGKALIGHKAGETIDFSTPSGTQSMQIVSVR